MTDRAEPGTRFPPLPEVSQEAVDEYLTDVRVAQAAMNDRAEPGVTPQACGECLRQERLLAADPSEEWVADAWARATAHPHSPGRASADCVLARFDLTPHSHRCTPDEDRAALAGATATPTEPN